MMKWVKELSPERARSLLDEKEISDDKLIRVLEQIKAFCKVAYQLYSKKVETEKDINIVKDWNAEPPNEFKNPSDL